MVNKSCGNCMFFVKIVPFKKTNGMCEVYDARTHSDNKIECREWKGVKYKRERIKKCEMT